MNAAERKKLAETLLAQSASDRLDMSDSAATWVDLCAIVADEDPNVRLTRMREIGLIDAEVEKHMDGMSPEKISASADSALLMSMAEMMRARGAQLHRLADATHLLAVTDLCGLQAKKS